MKSFFMCLIFSTVVVSHMAFSQDKKPTEKADNGKAKTEAKIDAKADPKAGSSKVETAEDNAKSAMKAATEKDAKAKDSEAEKEKAAKKVQPSKKKGLPRRMYAKFDLTHGGKPFGSFKARLFNKYAPNTVESFVSLAEGKKQFLEARTGMEVKPGKQTTRRFYDGVAFHRVIRGFMIQGGDPTGTGRYTPGWAMKDEFNPILKHKKGVLSMANPGVPDQNGTQFFVTVAKTPHLDNKHTIFGEVIEGYEVVEKASKIATDRQDKPLLDLVMEKVTIIREYK